MLAVEDAGFLQNSTFLDTVERGILNCSTQNTVNSTGEDVSENGEGQQFALTRDKHPHFVMADLSKTSQAPTGTYGLLRDPHPSFPPRAEAQTDLGR